MITLITAPPTRIQPGIRISQETVAMMRVQPTMSFRICPAVKRNTQILTYLSF